MYLVRISIVTEKFPAAFAPTVVVELLSLGDGLGVRVPRPPHPAAGAGSGRAPRPLHGAPACLHATLAVAHAFIGHRSPVTSQQSPVTATRRAEADDDLQNPKSIFKTLSFTQSCPLYYWMFYILLSF